MRIIEMSNRRGGGGPGVGEGEKGERGGKCSTNVI